MGDLDAAGFICPVAGRLAEFRTCVSFFSPNRFDADDCAPGAAGPVRNT
jgi:hypothetical protein